MPAHFGHRRLFRFLKVTSYVAVALCIIAEVVAARWPVMLQRNTSAHGFWILSIARSQLEFYNEPNMVGYADEVHIGRFPIQLNSVQWKPQVFWIKQTSTLMLGIPIWIPLLVALTASFFFWRACRKSSVGRCSKCDYDMTGLRPQAACPECGQAPAQAAPTRTFTIR